MTLTLFPYALVRYAGLSFRKLDFWNLQDYSTLLDNFISIDERVNRMKLQICDDLFETIKNQSDDVIRQQLIDLKRQVYNEKVESMNDRVAHLKVHLTNKAIDSYYEYICLLADQDRIKKQGQMLYQEQLIKHRLHLQKLAQDPDLQNALLLSSPVLFQQLSQFLAAIPDAFRQKEARMEFSLVRYLTRMGYKTSPFSSFTYTGLAEFQPKKHLSPPHGGVKSKVRLNNALFDYFMAIIRQHPALNEGLMIRLNPTTEIDGEKFRFFINHNNIESFQTLPAKGLQLLVSEFFEGTNEPVSFNHLITKMTDRTDDASYEAVKSYLLRLTATGFLHLGINVSGMDPDWDEKLLLCLKGYGVQHPAVNTAAEVFENLKHIKEIYAAADPGQRYSMLTASERQINSFFTQLQLEAGLPVKASLNKEPLQSSGDSFKTTDFLPVTFQSKHLFYEDCFTAATDVLPENTVKDFIKKVDGLLNYIQCFDMMQKERDDIYHFYSSHYNNRTRVPLLEFYKDYYFHFKKQQKHNDSQHAYTAGQLSSGWTLCMKSIIRQIIDPDENILRLSPQLLTDFASTMSLTGPNRQYSKALFVQFYEATGDAKRQLHGVINASLPGMGKANGRFLPLFDDQLTRLQQEFNDQLHLGWLKVELNDFSSFNANIHPPLLPHELILPGGSNTYAPSRQIEVKSLSVGYEGNDSGSTSLSLYYQDKPVYAFDLNLESIYFRSNLYQLLAHFNPDVRPSLKTFIQIIDECYLEQVPIAERDVYTLPRIVYDETVVVRRKTWWIKTSAIPVRRPSETEFSYFIRLNTWRAAHMLPESSFVFLRKTMVIKMDPEEKAGLSDDYKPQYMSFRKPLLVIVFQRLLQRAGKYIYMEEALPDANDMTGDADQVKEHFVQWYNY